MKKGKVVGIAIKGEHGVTLEHVMSVRVTSAGLVGNVAQSRKRRITFLSAEDWMRVEDELNTRIPWTIRRANILVEGIDLVAAIGQPLRVGDVTVLIHGETKPCAQMDAAHPGLLAALKPDCRAGVHGSVEEPGSIHIGDKVTVKGDTHG